MLSPVFDVAIVSPIDLQASAWAHFYQSLFVALSNCFAKQIFLQKYSWSYNAWQEIGCFVLWKNQLLTIFHAPLDSRQAVL